MSVNQDLRTNSTSTNNPYGLLSFVKPGRVLTPSSGPPDATLGTAYDEYIDMSTGIEYIKDFITGQWVATINYSSIPVIVPDPLVINELDVNTIKGDTTENVQVDLGAAGALSVGPHSSLNRVQILNDGTILTNSATSSVIVSDNAGSQTTYEPQQIVGNNVISVTADNDLNLTTNNGDIDIEAAQNVTLNCSNNLNLQVGGTSLMQLQSPNIIAVSASLLDTESGNYTVGSFANSFLGVYGTSVFCDNLAPNAAANVSAMASIIPSTDNSIDLGTALLAYREIYSNNVLNVTSDERRKKNIEPLVPGLDLIEQLCPVSFQIKDTDDERYKIGFIAQVTEVAMKEYDKYYDVVNYDKENDAYTMKYESLIGVLVKAVQELSQEVKELRKHVDSFEVADQEVTDEVSDEV